MTGSDGVYDQTASQAAGRDGHVKQSKEIDYSLANGQFKELSRVF